MTQFKFRYDDTAEDIADAVTDMYNSCEEEPLHYDIFVENGTLYLNVRKGDYKASEWMKEREL